MRAARTTSTTRATSSSWSSTRLSRGRSCRSRVPPPNFPAADRLERRLSFSPGQKTRRSRDPQRPRPPARLQATTGFRFAALGLPQLRVMRVLSIEDHIRLEVDLTLRPPS